MDVNVAALVHDSIDGGWIGTFATAKREEPSLATFGAALNAKIPHVNYVYVGIIFLLFKLPHLQFERY